MALEKDIVFCHHPPDFANFHFRRRRWPAKVIHGSIAHESRAHQSTSERTNRRWTMYRWLFEVGGGHGPTKWTRRRTADTRPSGGDLVDVPNAARGSEKVTQEKNPSNGQVGPFEAALGEFYTGNVFPFVVGAFGEVNEDASKLITKLARLTAKTDFGKSMSPLVSHSRKGGAFPIMQSQFRRALGCLVARGQPQHLLKRRHPLSCCG